MKQDEIFRLNSFLLHLNTNAPTVIHFIKCKPVVKGDYDHVLLENVTGPEEHAGAAAHDVGATVEVNNDGTLP